LEKGDKVKFTVLFKGREMQHSHLGKKLMDRIINDITGVGKVEIEPKLEGRQIITIIQPL
jgi:translation initiation factor IF-3